jgi:5-methylcytosine-specific restriction endonuclease McrA
MGKRRHIGDDRHRRSLPSLIASHKRRAAQHGQSIDYTAQDLLRLATDTTHCPYCGDTLKPGHYNYDHIKPLSRGGSCSITNMQVLCSRCNRRKGALDSVEYLMLINALDGIANTVGDTFCKCNVLKRLSASRF